MLKAYVLHLNFFQHNVLSSSIATLMATGWYQMLQQLMHTEKNSAVIVDS